MEKFNRDDIQKTVTDQIIASLEAGGLPPWKCPWTVSGEPAFPFNGFSKKTYSGVNVIILWIRAMMEGYTSNAWFTVKQANQLGGNVRKGEKGTRCIFYAPIVVQKDSGDGDEEQVINLRRSFVVFNRDQLEGLDSTESLIRQEFSNSEVIRLIDDVARRSGVPVRFGGDRAFYAPMFDRIQMPTTFVSDLGYAATLAHELVHSTGHSKRINRFDDSIEEFNSEKQSYAFEELVAEIGAEFVCAELGIENQHEQHASYIDYWLSHLKKDKTFIFKAAAAASKAHNLLMGDLFKSEQLSHSVVQQSDESLAQAAGAFV